MDSGRFHGYIDGGPCRKEEIMKRVLLVFACAVLLTPFSRTAVAQDTKWVRGTISEIGGDSITVKVRDQQMKFVVNDDTRVTTPGGTTQTRAAKVEGKTGPNLADLLKVGQGLEVRYRAEGMVATSLRRLPGANPGETSEDKPAEKPATTADGTVSAISGTSLTVKGKTEEWTFTVDGNTKVVGTGMGTAGRQKQATTGSGPAITDLLGIGDSVQVRFHDMNGTKHASEVRVIVKVKK
jgi:hypothetical protein